MPMIQLLNDEGQALVTFTSKQQNEIVMALNERAAQLRDLVKEARDGINARVAASLTSSAESCEELAEILEE